MECIGNWNTTYQLSLSKPNLPRLKKKRFSEDLIAVPSYLIVSYRKDGGKFSEMYHEEQMAMITTWSKIISTKYKENKFLMIMSKCWNGTIFPNVKYPSWVPGTEQPDLIPKLTLLWESPFQPKNFCAFIRTSILNNLNGHFANILIKTSPSFSYST